MLRLTRCVFEGLRGFEKLDLSDLSAVTVFVGPNGSGKSTILRVLRLCLSILNKNTLCDLMEKHDEWERFSVARLHFHRPEVSILQRFAEYFGGPFNEIQQIEVEIVIEDGQFLVRRVRCGEHTMSFEKPLGTKALIAQTLKEIDALKNEIGQLEKKITPQNPQQANQFRSQLKAAEAELGRKNTRLDELHTVSAKPSSQESHVKLQRQDVDDFLGGLQFPMLQYVDARRLHEDAIPSLIAQLLKDKKGRKDSLGHYLESIDRLSHLLQAEVDISEVENKQELHVNGASYERASSGTQISLSFFGLTKLGDPGCIILWDEPENGLHPTRRSRLLDLMFQDGRQFVLATHAAEFAPVLADKGRVFRSSSRYDPRRADVKLSVEHVADRRGAFESLEALGVHPARALFTANVVIWVEGPTELLFYRHWLNPRMRLRKLHEGFHYTFMQYGGALISYLSIADEAQVESTFDLLSMCRHPVVIVDSDLRREPNDASPRHFLKKGAARLFDEVQKLNGQRPGAAKFFWTSGREIENYLPESAIWHAVASLWKGYGEHEQRLHSKQLVIGKYDSVFEALKEHFLELGVVDSDCKDPKAKLPKGRSVWGPDNKVDMMRSALAMDPLTVADLKLDCVSQLSEIEKFVAQICER